MLNHNQPPCSCLTYAGDNPLCKRHPRPGQYVPELRPRCIATITDEEILAHIAQKHDVTITIQGGNDEQKT